MQWQALSYKPLYLLLVEHLKSKITSGVFPEGSFLPPIREMMRLFGVSLITVRKALNILSQQNMVKITHGSGIRVICKNQNLVFQKKKGTLDIAKDINDMFFARSILEVAALEDSFHKINFKKLVSLHKNSKEEVYEVDEIMHDEIFNKCSNVYIKEALSNIMNQIEFYRQINFRKRKESIAIDYEMIKKIIKAIANNDNRLAKKRLLEHIDYTRKTLLNFLDRN
ncbi:MAG: GntR family transcriptional regulator [Candidatus Theseobacter exili]|nr:GntR family transcriptional regulator [Candidatus Theseobacter exili]